MAAAPDFEIGVLVPIIVIGFILACFGVWKIIEVVFWLFKNISITIG